MSEVPSNVRPRIKKRKHAEAEKAVRHYDKEGDVEIVSSDKVVFKLPAYHLQAAS
jgi:hypothetical protein